jgi:predicted ATPase
VSLPTPQALFRNDADQRRESGEANQNSDDEPNVILDHSASPQSPALYPSFIIFLLSQPCVVVSLCALSPGDNRRSGKLNPSLPVSPRPQARMDIERALKDAREIGHAATLMYAIGHAQLPYTHCGNYAIASTLSDELVALANEKGASYWKAFGIMNQGLLFALTDKATDAVDRIGSGLTAWRSTGSTLWMPLYLAHLALAHAQLGRRADADAWQCIGEAMSTVETTKERWCEADVHRIAGEIALMAPEPDAAKAEAYFDHALAVARQQQAKSLELRAAMSLVRLWRHQGQAAASSRTARPGLRLVHRGF